MTPGEWASWAQAFFGLCTFGAALVAVRASYDAPRRAAEFAEGLRQEHSTADERRRMKLTVLSTLLQHRATFEYPDAVNALNLITIAFVDDQEVRDAYTHFLQAAEISERFSGPALRERYLALIEKIVRNVRMSDRITVADIHQGYYPTFMEKQRLLLGKDIEERFTAAFPGFDASPK